jgi:hypothetical protein
MRRTLFVTGLGIAVLLLAALGWTFSLGRALRARLTLTPERSAL